jgi:large subunit ribosomal protein L4
MKAVLYNQEGQEKGTVLLPKEIFGLKINQDLVHQVLVSQRANRRRNIAHTKDRSEVSGGGKKPWRQKGTGRSRHGSIRSPLWKGGGITFGPRKEKVFKKIIPKKIKRLALFMVLSGKLKDNSLLILDDLKINEDERGGLKGLAKKFSKILEKLPCKGQKTLIVLPKLDKKLILATRNFPKIQTIQASNLNVLDILSFKYLLMPKEAIRIIKENFLKK